MKISTLLFVLTVCWSMLWSQPLPIDLPANFVDELYSPGWRSVVGIEFDANGRLYAWSKLGLVHIGEEGQQRETPLLDIREEVATYGDHGLLGFALHPNFLNNGFFYVYYVVDRHHLLYHGTPDYSPTANIKDEATIARITRYTADPATNMTSVIPGSRKILVGESITTGFPVLHRSHSGGALGFGNDGTLMASCGDGASYAGTDVGDASAGAFAQQALTDGIITPEENVGAYRAQLVSSLNGKVIRIDPNTGDGVSSNPFFDPDNPRSAQSRVWALGLRQPFRFVHMPGSGSHQPELGDPGVFYLGDVGWAFWEELNVIQEGGQNFGWPIYEGVKSRWQYASPNIANLTAPNPSAGEGGCDKTHFLFKDLLQEATLEPDPFFANPCDPASEIPANIPRFLHSRPMVTFSNTTWNSEEQNTYIPTYDSEGNGSFVSLLDPSSPVKADTFSGSSCIAGVFYTGNSFPSEYQMSFMSMDYDGWIRKIDYSSAHEALAIEPFFGEGKFVVDVKVHPLDGCIYYLNYAYNSSIRRICYGTNPAPTAQLTFDQNYGPSPLTVQFTGDLSADPEGEPISYLWDFGDGETSTEANPTHTFTAPSSSPTSFEIRLQVSDSSGNMHEVDTLVSLNNTPPVVEIVSFKDGDTYTTTGLTNLELIAQVSDAEHAAENLSLAWQAHLHHNSHYHPEEIDTARESSILILGEGCGDESYWYRVSLTVTDPVGLATYVEQEIFPFCGDSQTAFDTLTATPREETVFLEWTTLRETPGTTFFIQRSEDKKIFETLNQLPANGTASSYSLEDLSPRWDLNHYRIMTVGADGFQDYSPVVSLDYFGVGAIRLFPNPVVDRLTLEFSEINEQAFIRLTNLQGQTVFLRKWVGSSENEDKGIDVKFLPTGIYIYEISDGTKTITGKLIKHAF
ncbi:MAG: PQQ-dependent sugar dehydrogenase [Bacteroidota bacterium]